MIEAESGAGPQTGTGDPRTRLRGDGETRAEREARATARAAAEPRSFGTPPGPGPLADAAVVLPLAVQARHLELLSQRGHAVADYWGELAHAREPGDIVKANTNYWSRLMEDYLSAAAGDAQDAENLIAPQRTQ